MTHWILIDNQNKRRTHPFWMLLCFSMFTFWQMGFIYFMGPALSLDGRTPLPISMDNITVLIAIAYVISIVWMIAIPQYVVWTERITTIAAFVSILGLFLPLPGDTLRLLIYFHVFCCCFMIGFETFIMVNYFSERSVITHLSLAYGTALFLISIVQNDFLPITFPTFRLVVVAALILLLAFLFRIPAGEDACPRYIRKGDSLTSPKKLIAGSFVLIFISSLMGVSGPSISGEVPHGVCITYFVDALASLLIFYLYKKSNIHPFLSISACMALGAIGFLFMFVSSYLPGLEYVSCVLLGFAMVTCQMIPLYCLVLMKHYPSRFFVPSTIGLALAAVLVQGSMVEFFRDVPVMLNLAYGVIMVILAIIYLQLEPFFLYTLRRHIPDVPSADEVKKETSTAVTTAAATVEEEIPSVSEDKTDNLLLTLTKREMEVVDLISSGYSNSDIANILFISVHTVNDHTKKIYRKMNVHSRFELAALVNQLKKKEV